MDGTRDLLLNRESGEYHRLRIQEYIAVNMCSMRECSSAQSTQCTLLLVLLLPSRHCCVLRRLVRVRSGDGVGSVVVWEEVSGDGVRAETQLWRYRSPQQTVIFSPQRGKSFNIGV